MGTEDRKGERGRKRERIEGGREGEREEKEQGTEEGRNDPENSPTSNKASFSLTSSRVRMIGGRRILDTGKRSLLITPAQEVPGSNTNAGSSTHRKPT